MSDLHSFDIVCKLDHQEINNAINQVHKELQHRYDLKDAACEVEFKHNENSIQLKASDHFKIKALYEILIQKLIKRNVSPKAISAEEIESGLGGTAKQTLKLQDGIATEKAKELTKDIKGSGIKVQTQIQDNQLRVSSKKIDDLRSIMTLLQQKDYGIFFTFTNYR